jgi:hypothetical protein
MTRALPPIREFHASSGWSLLLSVASPDPTEGTNRRAEGAQAASCAVCGHAFPARRSTAMFLLEHLPLASASEVGGMSRSKVVCTPIVRLAYRGAKAAPALGVSFDHLDGRVTVYPTSGPARWLEANAERVLDTEVAR